MENTRIFKMRRNEHNYRCLMDTTEANAIQAAKISSGRYGLLAKPWISFRPAPGDSNLYKQSTIKLLQWMEAEV